MKPPRFAYYDPTTVPEAIALLARHGEEAKLIAGGQSLMPMLNMRLARPAVLIDLNRVEGLAYIRDEGDALAIGAMTRHAAVEKSEMVAARQPLLSEAVRHVGHIQIRNRGTIGGSLVHADPAAELPAVMVALEATLRLTGPSGTRDLPAEEFFVMYFTTAVRPDEILTEVRVPALPPRSGWAFAERARRSGDFALCAVACQVTLDAAGAVADCRLGLQGVGMAPVRPREAESLLAGRRPSEDLLRAVARAVQGSVTPDSDVHATAEYRQQLAGVLTLEALAAAVKRAEERGAGA